MEAAREAAAATSNLESEATALLAQCFSSARLFQASPEIIESSVKKLIEREAEEERKTAEADSIILSKIMQEASNTIAKAGKTFTGRGTFKFNDGILRYFLNSANSISVREMRIFEYMKASTQSFKEAHNATDAIKERQKVNNCMFAQYVTKRQAVLLMLRCRLLAFLQKDMSYVVSELERIATRDSHLSNLGKQKYGQLQRQLSAALINAETASALVDAARAISDVRTHFLALQDFVLESSKGSNGCKS